VFVFAACVLPSAFCLPAAHLVHTMHFRAVWQIATATTAPDVLYAVLNLTEYDTGGLFAYVSVAVVRIAPR